MILREAGDAYAELEQWATEPSGTLRLTAPNDYRAAVVVPVAAAFYKIYPACRVNMDLSDQRCDLHCGERDMAIRLGRLSDSDLQASRIGTFRQYLACRRAFAAKLACIAMPEQLENSRLLQILP